MAGCPARQVTRGLARLWRQDAGRRQREDTVLAEPGDTHEGRRAPGVVTIAPGFAPTRKKE